ncbi:MAG TPA: tetratricopeptide repeat protein [Steroidobacteraceae bacterium]|nr:tetratricopeptide repeat protein [Steroidobacteraceae bacterium]
MNKSRYFTPLLSAIFAAVLSLGLGVSARAADSAKHTVSRQIGKDLQQAQEDEKKGNYRDALEKLDKANGYAKKTPWDQHVINALAISAYLKTKDYKGAIAPMEALATDGFTDPQEVKEIVRNLSVIQFQLKNYDKAIDNGERALKGGFADSNTYTILMQSYYLKGDYKSALRFTTNRVDDEIKSGRTPSEQELLLIESSCEKLNNQQCLTHSFERLVTYYPKPEYWQNLIITMYNSKEAENNDSDMLNIYRLANDVGAMKQPREYNDMAQLSLELGFPGEAQRVLEKAFAQNVFTDAQVRQRAQRLLDKAKKEAVSDQASLPKLQQEAANASTGDKEVALGTAYLSYQKYGQAVTALQQGIAKGGLKTPAQAKLLLGIAELKAGNKDAAVKSFHDVKGDPVLERLANLWSVRAREQSGTVASR